MKHLKILMRGAGILLLLVTCAPQERVVKTKPLIQSATPTVRVNPWEYDTADSGIVFTPVKRETAQTITSLPDDQYVIINVDKKAWEEEKKRTRSLAEDEEHQLGFRVQLYTSTILDSALAMKDSVANRFTLDVYLEHDAPYYKIRLGDFLDHDEAKKAKERIVNYGYKEAWIVRSEICHSCRKRREGTDIFADTTAGVPQGIEQEQE